MVEVRDEEQTPAPDESGKPAGAAQENGDGSKKERSFLRQLAELPFLVLVAFLIAIVIKTFLVQAFFIPSGSMIPTLRDGDRVLVEKVSYRLRDPSQKDVIVFAKEVLAPPPDVPWTDDVRNFMRELVGLPVGDEEDYIKRIVAVGGDRVRYSGTPRQLVVNGERVDQPFIRGGVDRASPTLTDRDCRRLEMESADDGCIVPEGSVFVMGDNRGDSQDSRFFGPIHEEDIIGKAFVIIWPIKDLGTL